jgi:hypothetical protein
MHFYMHSYLHKIFILVKSGCYIHERTEAKHKKKCEAKHVKKCEMKHESKSEVEHKNENEAANQGTHHEMSL